MEMPKTGSFCWATTHSAWPGRNTYTDTPFLHSTKQYRYCTRQCTHTFCPSAKLLLLNEQIEAGNLSAMRPNAKDVCRIRTWHCDPRPLRPDRGERGWLETKLHALHEWLLGQLQEGETQIETKRARMYARFICIKQR